LQRFKLHWPVPSHPSQCMNHAPVIHSPTAAATTAAAGEPIQAACCCLAADDVPGALACLAQGTELELAAALALALAPCSAACDAALAACAQRAQLQGCFREAAALLDKVGCRMLAEPLPMCWCQWPGACASGWVAS
jgi:hypothetical protein